MLIGGISMLLTFVEISFKMTLALCSFKGKYFLCKVHENIVRFSKLVKQLKVELVWL